MRFILLYALAMPILVHFRESVVENLNFIIPWCSQRLSFIFYVIMTYFPFGFPCPLCKVQHTHADWTFTFFSDAIFSWWFCQHVKLSHIGRRYSHCICNDLLLRVKVSSGCIFSKGNSFEQFRALWPYVTYIIGHCNPSLRIIYRMLNHVF